MQNRKINHLTQAASIAALYVVLTLLSNVLGLANYAIQVRFSEALTILPLFTPAAIPGLYVGCLLSNILTGCIVWDIIFGPLATLLGALGTRYLCQKCKWAAPLPPSISTSYFVPFTVTRAIVDDSLISSILTSYGLPLIFNEYFFIFCLKS